MSCPRRLAMRFCALVCLLATCDCATLKSVSFTHVPRGRGETVRASAHDWAFLNLHSSNDFIEEVRRGLLTQCPNSNITGIFTKYETFNYVGVVKRVVTATGFCNREDAPPETLDTNVGNRSDTVNGSDAGTAPQHNE